MSSVFILQHTYERDGQKESKFIGVYSSAPKAQNAVRVLSEKSGFSFSAEGFHVSEYEMDATQWTEGFAIMTPIYVKGKNGEWVSVQAECLSGKAYRITELYNNEALDEFRHEDVVNCEERNGELYAVSRYTM